MSLKSTLGIAKTGTTSLRVTVPEGIVAFLNLKAGDKLEWKMEIIDNERVTLVKKVMTREEEMNRIKLKYDMSKEKGKL
jgi:bifunctional DNA-binding transcriptional regulator/antitoxin component of YhaV-PrlF toxin-antitoxin module